MKVPLTLPCINNQDTTTIWQGRMARPFSSVHSSWSTKPRHLNFIIYIHFTATTDVHSMKGYTPQRKDHSRSLTYQLCSPALFAQSWKIGRDPSWLCNTIVTRIGRVGPGVRDYHYGGRNDHNIHTLRFITQYTHYGVQAWPCHYLARIHTVRTAKFLSQAKVSDLEYSGLVQEKVVRFEVLRRAHGAACFRWGDTFLILHLILHTTAPLEFHHHCHWG